MRVDIYKSWPEGGIRAPPSKSLGIRLLFYSVLSRVTLYTVPEADDVTRALDAMRTLGVGLSSIPSGGLTLTPRQEYQPISGTIYVGGSGTTARMLVPILGEIGCDVVIDGDESLRKRTMRSLKAFEKYGLHVSSDHLPVRVRGKITESELEVDAKETSQHISGLVYALLMRGGGTIRIIPPINSEGYIKMTVWFLNQLGADIKYEDGVISVSKGDMRAYEGYVPGDYLLSSFYAAMAFVGSKVTVENLYEPPSWRGDHDIVKVFGEMGLSSKFQNGVWVTEGPLSPSDVSVNVEYSPDMAMSILPLAVVGGKTTIDGTNRLSNKESDRLSAIELIARSFGAGISRDSTSVTIMGSRSLNTAVIDCMRDHRVAMSSSVPMVVSQGSITNAECVSKSNPTYWQDLKRLGVDLRVT